MSDLVERLRSYDWMPISHFREIPGTMREAADRIEELEVKVIKLTNYIERMGDEIEEIHS